MIAPTVLGAVRDERRVRIRVGGTVQGVGFRPFVFRLATSLGLGGSVRNDAVGVVIELEGVIASIDTFIARLSDEAPPHARIVHVDVHELFPTGLPSTFQISPSTESAATLASVPPDLCVCADCRRELFDPANPRYRYPFINCTACGPRFTIARGLPYDRASTSMAGFVMCPSCRAEYDDPHDRRFHAQPNACPRCGPTVALIDANGSRVAGAADDPIAAAARALLDGAIVAVKGLGGFHIACRADDAAAVTRLRRNKQREDKPFAIMVRDTRAAGELVRLDAFESRLLSSDARPIVVARASDRGCVAPQVAPGRSELGVMLPYAPLHYVLMADVGLPLIMTSGNLSDEPIAYRDDEAVQRLGPIVDLLLTNDRPIEERCEDSVLRVVSVAGAQQPLFIRRSRGFVPLPISTPTPAHAPILATGGQLKNTACVLRGNEATVGPHGGDLNEAHAFAAYARGIEHLVGLSGMRPKIVAHDLHPEYDSTKYALEHTELCAVGVQHHHAHLAACLAEHGETEPAIGLIFDGAGYGVDGDIWGGEILFGDLGAFTRLGHLRTVRMPGGDAAVREPWRMACAWLTDAHDGVPRVCTALRDAVGEREWATVSRITRTSNLWPLTTSVGRLLDACAAICGVRARTTYEGQAAIELEVAAGTRGFDDRGLMVDSAGANEGYPMTVSDDGDIVLDPRSLILAVEHDANAGCALTQISSRIHKGLIYAAQLGARIASERTGCRTVVLSGGVFQNVLLLEGLSRALTRAGMRVLVPRRLPPNDGGLSYGQAVVAAWQRRNDVPGHSGADC